MAEYLLINYIQIQYLIEEELKIFKLEYLSNYWSDRTQIKVTKPKLLNASIEETSIWKTISNHWSDLTLQIKVN